MDSRDSPSSQSPTAVTRDSASGAVASSTAEDDAVLSVNAALAKDASLHFQSRRFADCLAVLHQIKQKKEDDPKVFHNIAIAEYYRDGCSDPRKLLEVLNNVKKKSEQLAQTSREQVDATNGTGNKATQSSKGSGGASQQCAASNGATLIYMDEYDPAVATLNMAIIWFHLHDYKKALSVLEPLYHNIEPIEETTALHVCLLLLDVALACQDASKSADVLIYLEKAFGVGGASQGDGSTTQQQSPNLVAKASSVPISSSAVDVSNSDAATSANTLENSLSRTLSLSEEILEYETMFSLDISGQNLTRPSGLSSVNDLSRAQVDRTISAVDLKLKLQLYKVRFLLLTKNLKQAKREVKLAMNIARGRDSSTALFLKSQLEYARGNYRKAIKLLMASSNRTEMGNSSMFNNLGCIYFQLGKCHSSSVLLSKALSRSSSLRKEKPLKMLTFSQDKSLLIMYNSGIQHLVCGKPFLAARCFHKASLIFYNLPILWLRLAECCLVALDKGLINATDNSEILVHSIGKGKWRYLAIENGKSRNGFAGSAEGEGLQLGSDDQPKLSLTLARQFLLNALHLLDSSDINHLKSSLPSSFSLEENESSDADSLKTSNCKSLNGPDTKASNASLGLGQLNSNGDLKDPKGGMSQEIMQNSISHFRDIRRRENQIIKQALLADLAFVELELRNPEKALSAAKCLLEFPECSRIYVFLSHVYAAEALCLLGKPKEAAEYLSIYLSGDNNVELPFSQEDSQQLRVDKVYDYEEANGGSGTAKNFSVDESQGVVFLKPEEARGILYANFATMYAAQGETERASHFVTQALSLIPDSSQATLTAVYVDLVLGESQAAISKLKQCSRVRFVPSHVQWNKL